MTVCEPFHCRYLRQVVANRRPVLDEVLRRVAPADAKHVDVILTDEIGVLRTWIPVEPLEGDREVVQPGRSRNRPAAEPGIDAVRDVVGALEAVLSTEVTHVRLGAEAVADVEVLADLRLVRAFREHEALAELAREGALVRAQEIEKRRCPGAQEHLLAAILPVLLVSAEHLEPVLDDRSPDREAGLPAPIRRLLEIAFLGVLVGADQVLVLIEHEGVTRPAVGPALRHGRDHRARGLLVLGLEVLRQHLELLHRALWKRRAAARVLADDAALQDVVLEADAVDEDVDLGRIQSAARDLLPGLVLRSLHAGGEVGEVEKVALVLRQIADLFGRHAGRDFRGPGLDDPAGAGDDLHLLGVNDVGRDAEVDGRVLAEEQLDGLRLRLVLVHRHGDVVRAGPHARQGEEPGRVRHCLVGEAAFLVACRHRGAREDAGVVTDGAANAPGRRLRQRRPSGDQRAHERERRDQPISASHAFHEPFPFPRRRSRANSALSATKTFEYRIVM